jgi:hypothetical protein
MLGINGHINFRGLAFQQFVEFATRGSASAYSTRDFRKSTPATGMHISIAFSVRANGYS